MGEKTPDTDESGIERRNVLKGLGFGAMGAVGVSALAGNAAADVSPPLNAGITPPDEDLEDDEVNASGVPSLSSGEYDLVVHLPMSADQNVVAKHFAIKTYASPPKAANAFEEGTAEASIERVKTDEKGMVTLRERFNVEGLSSGQYVASLMVHDYTPLSSFSVIGSGSLAGTLQGTDTSDSGVNASNYRQVIAHRFDV